MELFGDLRKHIVDKSIQIKDPEKTIHQIDEIVNYLPSLSSHLKNLKDQLMRLESSVNPKNMRRLEDIQSKTEMYEKYRSENILRIEETRKSISELDSAIKVLKNKIEENVFEITGTRYRIGESYT
jgi:chromosome segregation ATPase